MQIKNKFNVWINCALKEARSENDIWNIPVARFLEIGSAVVGTNNITLMLRKCYEELYAMIIKSEDKIQAVTGNPGIGKTYFGIYLAIMAIKNGLKVVYNRGCPYFLSSDAMYKVKRGLIGDVDLYILDA